MGAWGGQRNGEISLSALCEFEQTGKFLHWAAAATLTALFDSVKRESGDRPYIAAGQDLYRDLSKQITLLGQNYIPVSSGSYALIWNGKKWRKTGPVSCAVPGTSNHGWALAADISFPTAASHAAWRHLCPQYDWDNAGDAFGESWHKEYVGSLTTPAGSGNLIEEDDMYDDNDRARDNITSILVKQVDLTTQDIQKRLVAIAAGDVKFPGAAYPAFAAIAAQNQATMEAVLHVQGMTDEQIAEVGAKLLTGLPTVPDIADAVEASLRDDFAKLTAGDSSAILARLDALPAEIRSELGRALTQP